MKKSTLLSLVTAGAIVVTSAGTYAVWDSLSAETAPATVTIDKAVTTEISELTFTAPNRTELTEVASGVAQTSQVTVTVEDFPADAVGNYELKFTSEVKKSGVATDEVVVDIDSTKTDAIVAGNEDYTATVTVTPKEAISTTGGSYDVVVKAQLVKVNP